LDRVVCNQAWFDTCCASSVSSLTRLRSDHFPLLFEFKTTTTTYASQFKFLKMWPIHPDCRTGLSYNHSRYLEYQCSWLPYVCSQSKVEDGER
jgi:hypothetical protein